MAHPSKSLFIKTYGCQMNVYDSERMADCLAVHGYREVGNAEAADLVVLNTCHIREKAAEKVYSELGRLRRLRDVRQKATGRDMVIAVAGCVAQAEGKVMLERAPFVDIVVGPQTYHRLPEMLETRRRGTVGVLDTEFPVESKFDLLPAETGASGISAFLTVQEGCDKFCTFCVVPYTRGAEDSRPAADVLAEARRLVHGGAREITLLGQNVNAYHGDGPDGHSWNLARLIRSLADIEDVWRIRYTTSHPRDMDDDLIGAHRDVPALMPFLHLPVQSGSDVVLAAMNRRYTCDDYRRIVDRLRDARPDLALSSDFIVGFPGEGDDDFDMTLDLVREIGFAQSYSFNYSPRPGTPGSTMGRQIADTIKSRRLQVLQSLLDDQARAFNQAMLGRHVDVLVERAGRHDGQLVGRSPYLQAVHLDANGCAIGDLVTAVVTDIQSHSLGGRRANAPVEGISNEARA